MNSVGRSYSKVKQVACYKFGQEKPIRSEIVWTYQVGIQRRVTELRMGEISRECPGLIGLDGVAAWGMCTMTHVELRVGMYTFHLVLCTGL